MSDVFDTEALRQAATMPFPAGDFKRQTQLWTQMAADLDAAADYILELEDKLADPRNRDDNPHPDAEDTP